MTAGCMIIPVYHDIQPIDWTAQGENRYTIHRMAKALLVNLITSILLNTHT